MLWKLLQLSVFIAVMFTGIYYEWTPNGYVLTLLSLGASFAATLILSEFFRLLSWAFQARRRLLSKQRLQHRPPGRW